MKTAVRTSLFAIALAPTLALGDVIPPPILNGEYVGVPTNEQINPIMPGDRILRATDSAVKPDDEATVSLKMFNQSGDEAFINADGEKPVTRGPDEVSIGANANGTGNILAKWDEFTGNTTNTIQTIWRTDNGEEFLPAGVLINGEPAAFLGWRFGAEDPVDWRRWVDHVDIVSALVALSTDGGQTFNTFDITSAFSNPWDGTDVGITLALAGTGTNYILTRYEFSAVPTPAGAALFALAGLASSTRRRRH